MGNLAVKREDFTKTFSGAGIKVADASSNKDLAGIDFTAVDLDGDGTIAGTTEADALFRELDKVDRGSSETLDIATSKGDPTDSGRKIKALEGLSKAEALKKIPLAKTYELDPAKDKELAALQAKIAETAIDEEAKGIYEDKGEDRGTRVDDYAKAAGGTVGEGWCSYFVGWAYSTEIDSADPLDAEIKAGSPFGSPDRLATWGVYHNYLTGKPDLDKRSADAAGGSMRKVMTLDISGKPSRVGKYLDAIEAGVKKSETKSGKFATPSPIEHYSDPEKLAAELRPGDIFIFNPDRKETGKDGTPLGYSHAGLVVDVGIEVDKKGKSHPFVITVEGNVSDKLDVKKRYLDTEAFARSCLFVRPALSDLESTTP